MKKAYVLEIEDATNLGGPMGTEYTSTVGIELFETESAAKKYAEQHCKKEKGEWVKSGDHSSWDAGGFIYTIRIQEVR